MCKKPKKIVKEVTRPFKQVKEFVEDSVDYVQEQVDDAVDFVTEDIPQAVGIAPPPAPAPAPTPDPAPLQQAAVEEEDPKKKRKKKLGIIQSGSKQYRNPTSRQQSVNVGGGSGLNISKG